MGNELFPLYSPSKPRIQSISSISAETQQERAGARHRCTRYPCRGPREWQRGNTRGGSPSALRGRGWPLAGKGRAGYRVDIATQAESLLRYVRQELE